MTSAPDAPVAALLAAPTGVRALAVGFSGGLDSTALLHALSHHGPALALRAIHVCHHLQPEAERWAEGCRARCRAWDVRYTRLDVAVERGPRGIEAGAREARYRAIGAVLEPGEALVTAHHLDDQAETFLLQALRGGGPQGLAGMPVIGHIGAYRHWRPWLALSRAQIRAYADHSGLSWIEDPSNQDPSVARSFVRGCIMPRLRQRWPAAPRTLARAARHAQEGAEAIDALAAIDLTRARTADGRLRCRQLDAMSWARGKQVIRRWLAEAGRDVPQQRQLDEILRLPRARLAASPCVTFADSQVRLFDAHLYAMPRLAPAPADARLRWQPGCELVLPAGCGTLVCGAPEGAAPSLDVRFRHGGERLARAGGGHRRLKEALRVAAIAPWVRERTPLLWYRGGLVAVAGLWRHPQLAQVLGVDLGPIAWHHRVLDGRASVVRI